MLFHKGMGLKSVKSWNAGHRLFLEKVCDSRNGFFSGRNLPASFTYRASDNRPIFLLFVKNFLKSTARGNSAREKLGLTPANETATLRA
jgi:hypothetical protein